MNNILEGTATIFTAKVAGEPRPAVEVFHDQEKIEANKFVDIKYFDDGNVKIIFHKASRDDDGTYKLVAKNEHGESHTEGELLIEFDPTEG